MTETKYCPIQKTLQLIGGKWKLVILFNLQNKPKRFGELKRDLSPITQQMLTKELRDYLEYLSMDKIIFLKIP